MNNSGILIYQAADGKINIDVRLEDETVWLTQDHMAGLFGKSKKTISEHIRNIFSEGELEEQVVVRKFRTTTRPEAASKKGRQLMSSMDAGAIRMQVSYGVWAHPKPVTGR